MGQWIVNRQFRKVPPADIFLCSLYNDPTCSMGLLSYLYSIPSYATPSLGFSLQTERYLEQTGPQIDVQPGSRPKSDPSYCIHSPDVGIPPSFVIRVCYQPRSKSRPVILRCSPSSDRRLAPQWLGSSPPFTASRLLSQANMMSLRDPPALTSSSELRDLSLKPDVYPARITIIHTQLRDLICPLERAKVLHPRGTTIEQLSWTVPDEGDDGHLKTSVCSFEKGAVADGRSTL